jgi:hypothetical protein
MAGVKLAGSSDDNLTKSALISTLGWVVASSGQSFGIYPRGIPTMLRKYYIILAAFYTIATVQFAWCYFWLTRPYINTALYEQGLERMPFQGRVLMALPMRLAHQSSGLRSAAEVFAKSPFWFPKPVQPEVLVQAIVNIFCLLVSGYLATELYRRGSKHRLLTPFIYPIFLAVCGATYVMHTVQNFRFIYDFPSMAFFALGMYLIYLRKHWIYFAAFFLIATTNRETTLLLLALYIFDRASDHGVPRWSKLLESNALAVALPLAGYWIAWQFLVRYYFASNGSEFYPRLDWNVKSILVPHAWPQLLSACGYLPIFALVMRRRIVDHQLKAWLWILPFWFIFMFVFGILIETRVYGELIPYIVCITALIIEQGLVANLKLRFPLQTQRPQREVVKIHEAA